MCLSTTSLSSDKVTSSMENVKDETQNITRCLGGLRSRGNTLICIRM